MSVTTTLSVEVAFDLICPWCLIGKRHLDTALAMLLTRRPDVKIEIDWRSYPLMPRVPKKGLPFADFYRQRLGSAEAVALRQAQVREAARNAGVEIRFECIAVFPNTLQAHRLVAQAHQQGGSALVGTVIDALFDAYFAEGRDIGDAAVLADIQAACGVLPAQAPATDIDAAMGSHGVPHFMFNGSVVVEGAQRPAVLLEAMLRALETPRV